MKTVYLPDLVGGGYGAFWRCRQRYRVVKGGKASKKSSTTALWYIYHLMKYPAANLLVVRSVHRTHIDSTYAQLRWAIRRLGVEHLWHGTREPLELTYTPTGQRILFRGLDNVEKLASTTVDNGYLCWVWLEEAFEVAREADFDKLDLSVPDSRMKTAYEFYDGTTGGQEAGGFTPATNAQSIGLLLLPCRAASLIKKTEQVRCFDPAHNLKADAWKLDYRLYYDVVIKDSLKNGVYAYVY